MRILLTGASGFIGQSLMYRYGQEHDIFVLGRSAGLATVPHTLVECDLNDPSAVLKSLSHLEDLAPFDVIIHMAVSRLHRTFPETALDLFNVNTVSTAYLMDFAYRRNVKHVILGSTGSVYNVPDGEQPTEDIYTKPKSYFAASKLAADCFAEQYRSVLPVSILRLFVPYGPGLEDRMLSNLAANIFAKKPVLVPENGPALTFAPVYSEDVVRAVESCMENVWNETVNVATAEAFTLDDAARVMAGHMGIDVQVETSPGASPYYLVPDITRLKTHMDVTQFTNFSDGIRVLLKADNYALTPNV